MWRLLSALRISKSAVIATVAALAPAESASAGAGTAPPVLLIHGMKDDCRKMEPLARYLRAQGRTVYTMSLVPSWGQLGLDQLAQQLASYVDQNLGDQQFDLVGYSMGGLVCRYYLQRLGGLQKVRRFVTISAPHQGSMLAWLIPNPGCRQMRPGSAFLKDLARDADELKQVGFVSIWTPLDLIIVPAHSSVLPSAECRRLWCVAHPLMVMEPRIMRQVGAALAG